MRDNLKATTMARHVLDVIDAKNAIIICCMKIMYHLVVNDRAINQYEDICQIIKHIRASYIHINNEYDAYTSR